jgi:hypothetical protein
MGADMSGGEGNTLHTRNGCSLVDDWCWQFEPKAHEEKMRDYDMMGVYDHTSEAVKAADAVVPHSFAEARLSGFIGEGASTRPVDEGDFLTAREFLRRAAEAGEGICGGY